MSCTECIFPAILFLKAILKIQRQHSPWTPLKDRHLIVLLRVPELPSISKRKGRHTLALPAASWYPQWQFRSCHLVLTRSAFPPPLHATITMDILSCVIIYLTKHQYLQPRGYSPLGGWNNSFVLHSTSGSGSTDSIPYRGRWQSWEEEEEPKQLKRLFDCFLVVKKLRWLWREEEGEGREWGWGVASAR